jgi:hypothetical protein
MQILSDSWVFSVISESLAKPRFAGQARGEFIFFAWRREPVEGGRAVSIVFVIKFSSLFFEKNGSLWNANTKF